MLGMMLMAAASASTGATPARSVNGGRDWVYVSDYPAAALREGRSGVVTVELQIGRDGSIEQCRIARSSGSADLDETSCTAMVLRGRYEPARNARGRRIVSHVQRQIVWDAAAAQRALAELRPAAP
jgi:protein TonB